MRTQLHLDTSNNAESLALNSHYASLQLEFVLPFRSKRVLTDTIFGVILILPIHILKNLDFGRFSLADPFKDKHRFATLLLQPSNITFVFFEFLFQYLNFFFKLFILWLQFKYFRRCCSYPNLNFSISGLTASYLTWNSIHQKICGHYKKIYQIRTMTCI